MIEKPLLVLKDGCHLFRDVAMDYFAQIEIMGYLRSSRDSDLFFSHEQVDFVVNNVKGNKLMHIDYILKDNLRTVYRVL